jgi:type I restriction enzyme S subunit
MNKKTKTANIKTSKSALVPKLRFPEFRNAPEWEEKPLEKIFAERIEKGHPEKAVLSATQDRGVIPYELLDKSVIRDRKNLAGYKLVRKEDFVISLRSFEGGFEYSDYEGIISPAYVILEKKLEVNNAFFQVMFKSSPFIKKIHKLLNNSLRDGKSISYNQAKGIVLTTPLSDEQQKIADCLSSVDELITAQAKKVEALKAHKKGLMQQLFPVPHVEE